MTDTILKHTRALNLVAEVQQLRQVHDVAVQKRMDAFGRSGSEHSMTAATLDIASEQLERSELALGRVFASQCDGPIFTLADIRQAFAIFRAGTTYEDYARAIGWAETGLLEILTEIADGAYFGEI